jgi:hypothetical protein
MQRIIRCTSLPYGDDAALHSALARFMEEDGSISLEIDVYGKIKEVFGFSGY